MNLDVFPLNLTVMDDYSDQSLFGHQIASIDKEHLILDGGLLLASCPDFFKNFA